MSDDPLDIIKQAGDDEIKNALRNHFADWLLTSDCKNVFEDLLERLNRCEVDDDTLVLIFDGDGYDGEGEQISAVFGPGHSFEGDDSYATVVRKHAEIVLGDPEGYGESVFFPAGGYDPYDEDEEILERFSDFCDAGQNWFVFDSKNKNSLGEDSICLWDHGGRLEDAEPYPGQDVDSYGAGGFLFRVLAYQVYKNSDRYEDFSYG